MYSMFFKWGQTLKELEKTKTAAYVSFHILNTGEPCNYYKQYINVILNHFLRKQHISSSLKFEIEFTYSILYLIV